MLRRLLRRGPDVGDDVTILVGSFSGHTGRIAERRADGLLLVVIDECCRPVVASADLKVVKRTSLAGQLGSIHRQIEQDPGNDITRAQALAAQRPGANVNPPTF
jgi:hypothetical protein